MPRIARKDSKSKVYHVILRGIDKQDIFFDEQDYKKFLREVINTKEKYKYDLYVYCLMPNHIHMVIFDKNNQLSKIMQSLEVSYSSYFNKKYERVGHLFQNRFLSKNVENQEYLMQLSRYIHLNPPKAGIAKVEEYRWSSYNEYIVKKMIIEDTMILSIFGNSRSEAITQFINFHNVNFKSKNGRELIEYEMNSRLTDEQVKYCVHQILEIKNSSEINEMSVDRRNASLRKLKEIKGTSIAQISRVIGINKKIIERAIKDNRKK